MNLSREGCTTIDNALTVDVEEWFHVCGEFGPGESPPSNFRVRKNIDRLLGCFDEHGVEATFFVLGSLAVAIPDLVPLIASAGHEIASHGFSHTMVSSLTPAAFREELKKTNDILDRQSGQRPIGFRAPQWSISDAKTPWAFDILMEEQFIYDSSCNPLPFVGDPGGSRAPYRIESQKGRLWEIPPMTTESLIGNLPTGGGWGFRFFPQGMIDKTIQGLNNFGKPAILYLHPREVDPQGPRLSLSLFREFIVYGPKTDAMERVIPLMRQYKFKSICRLVEKWESA